MNSLYLERRGCEFKYVHLKHNLGTEVLSIQVNINLESIPEKLVDG